jgi:rhamnogalacturonyl hydrolase YesR
MYLETPAMKNSAIVVIAACLLCSAASAEDRTGSLLVANLLARDYMFYGDEALHYAEAATAVGALRFAEATGDEASIARLTERYEALLDNDGPLVSRRAHVDMNVIGIVPLQIAIVSGDERHLAQGLSFADRQWAEPTAEGLTGQSRWWIDDLYMIGMLQMQAYRATGDLAYADRAARQLAAYLPVLQQDNGLFFHSPDVPIFWGRGNGWVAAALAEVLLSLPQDHELRPQLVAPFAEMMQTLLAYQDANGMWRQVIDHPSAWFESSGTAMFAYAMLVGINEGLLDREQFSPAIERAWAALVTRIDPEGNVSGVCVGTGKKNDLQYYLDRPAVNGDFHGQAPLLWLAAERLRALSN